MSSFGPVIFQVWISVEDQKASYKLLFSLETFDRNIPFIKHMDTEAMNAYN